MKNNLVKRRIFSFVIDALYKSSKYHRAFVHISNSRISDNIISAQSVAAYCCICAKYEVLCVLTCTLHFSFVKYIENY